ncbi:MAG: helix-turn-helix domain-containing protein [Candidatus Peribacteraceae bacterium]|nr:helix-turn-helix domain-containing protein [Candidatus Peribacteraceae bacterium]
MTVKEVASFLNLDPQTVRKYYRKLGGMRFGRSYRFFEKEVINALQKRQEMDGPNTQEWQDKEKNIFNQERGNYLGNRPEKTGMSGITLKDSHGLLN